MPPPRPRSGSRPSIRRHAGVVEGVVREQRPVVAVRASRLTDEEPQPGNLVCRQRRVGLPRQQRLDESVEAGRRRHEAALEGGDRLADVHEDLGHRVAVRIGHGLPVRASDRIVDRTRLVREARRILEGRERAEDRLVLVSVMPGDEVGVHAPVAAVLGGVLHRCQGLRPLAVLAPVPEQPRAVRGADDGHRLAPGLANALGTRQSVGEVELGPVAGRARDLAVGAEPRVGEDRLAECAGRRVVCDTVRRVVRQFRQAAEPQRPQRLDLVRAELRHRQPGRRNRLGSSAAADEQTDGGQRATEVDHARHAAPMRPRGRS